MYAVSARFGTGSTFNPALIQRMTEAAGEEAKVIGIHQILSPVLDIARELRWGRVEETFGEGPYLISEMGIALSMDIRKTASPVCRSILLRTVLPPAD